MFLPQRLYLSVLLIILGATDKRAPLQKYQGQPVIIWDDYGPVDLIESLK